MNSQASKSAYRTVRMPENGQQSNDVTLLIAIASMFYLFRKFEKAISIVAIAEHLEPENRSVSELKAVLQCELKEYKDVLQTIANIENDLSPLPDELNAIKRRAERAVQSDD